MDCSKVEIMPDIKNEPKIINKIKRGNELLCSVCYSNKVNNVCSFCGKYLCDMHSPWWNLFSHNVIAGMENALPQFRSPLYMCEEHNRFSISPSVIISLILLIFISIVGKFTGNVVFFIFLILPFLTFIFKNKIDAVLIGLVNKLKSHTIKCFPHLSFEFNEKIHMDYAIGTNKPFISSEKIKGSLSLKLRFDNNETNRLLNLYNPAIHKNFEVGFVKFENTHAINLAEPIPSELSGPTVANKLSSSIPNRFETLIKERNSIGIKIDYDCMFDTTDKDDELKHFLPFWIMPSTKDSDDLYTLGLDIKVNSNTNNQYFTMQSLSIMLPPELKEVDDTNGLYESDSQQVRWQNLKISTQSPLYVFIKFARPINNVDIFNCLYTVKIDGTLLSKFDIRSESVWDAAGRKLPQERIDISKCAVIEGHVEIATRLFPKKQEIIANKKCVIMGVYLTNELVQRVIEGVSERDVYTKFIREEPSTTLLQDKNIRSSKYLEIIGRHYCRYQPYDFHVILSGEESNEIENGDIVLNCEVIVRGISNMDFQFDKQNVDALTVDLVNNISTICRNSLSKEVVNAEVYCA